MNVLSLKEKQGLAAKMTPTPQQPHYPQRPQQYRYPQQQPAQQPQPQPRPEPFPEDMSSIRRVHHILDKRMIIPIIVIIVLIIAGFLIYRYITSPEEEMTEELVLPLEEEAAEEEIAVEAELAAEKPAYCADLVGQGTYASEDACFVALAEKNYNPDYCYGIEDVKKKGECFKKMAVGLLDAETCREIEEESAARCFFDVATASSQLDPCFEIPDRNGEFSQNHCIFEIAKQHKNEGVCGFIAFGEEPYTEENCIAAVTGA